MYRSFEEIKAKAKEIGPRKAAVLFPDHPDVMRAAKDGMKEGLIKPVLVGSGPRIEDVARKVNLTLESIEIVDQEDPQKAADLCLNMVRTGEAAFVVKGNILTTYLYRSLIRDTKQSAPDKAPCTLCFHEVQGTGKIFVITDPGVNILPDLQLKEKILSNTVDVLHSLGCARPKVMVLAADRWDGLNHPFIRDGIVLRQAARHGRFGDCEILAAHTLYRAFPNYAFQTEDFPDIFLVPNIETGNILVKSIDHLALGKRQCVTLGAAVVLTPSRSDGYEIRMTNLALGLVLATSGIGEKG